ncbi:unnamed protein product [Oreochromis niloticus]|nr:unnamed protein product [Mustela putorius furo]
MVIQADCTFAGAIFPHIVPNRLQFFEYESVSVHCEVDNNITEWSVKWKSHKIKNASHTSTSPCKIYPIFESHSGEYWCETEDGIKSEALNITITAGFVILETPTHPVMEGNEVILNCKNKKTQSEHITDFYKDGVSLGTWNQSSMTIKNVSKSDEGLYKCSIDGAGESPESWLAVIKQSKAGFVILEIPTHPVKEGNEVTLNCKNKETQSEHITDFYKDGVSLGTWNQSSMTIKNVSKSDEGLYKCSIDGAGESPESWLAVIKHHHQAPYNKTDLSHEVPKISHDEFPKTLILLWTVICVLLVDLLLLLVGLLLQNKYKVSACFSSAQGSHSCEDNTVLQEEYTQVSYASVQKELKVSGEHIETVIYSSVN